MLKLWITINHMNWFLTLLSVQFILFMSFHDVVKQFTQFALPPALCNWLLLLIIELLRVWRLMIKNASLVRMHGSGLKPCIPLFFKINKYKSQLRIDPTFFIYFTHLFLSSTPASMKRFENFENNWYLLLFLTIDTCNL